MARLVYKGGFLLTPSPLPSITLISVDSYPSSSSEISYREIAQGLPRWYRKLETEQEPEFAILILSAILFLISHFITVFILLL